MAILGVIFRSIFWLAVIMTPVLGVWLASSIATYLDGPRWLAIAVGAALFPGIPLLWEFWSHQRFQKKVAAASPQKTAPQRWLTTSDRMILRVLIVNILFLSVLIGAFPKNGFTAVSARGDWFLDGLESGPVVDTSRTVVFAAAEYLEWSYNAVVDNPYDTEPPPRVIEQAEVRDVIPVKPAVADVESEAPVVPDVVENKIIIEDAFVAETPQPLEPPDPRPPNKSASTTWPLKAELHPLVVNMPPSVETSIESVGTHLMKEADPVQRVKAIHDYVADRIAYDLRTNDSPGNQEAATVFSRRSAVCAGFAKLAVALGKVTGDEILYVVGQARTDKVGGESHAWNAVQINGRWYLMDITWDAGSGDGVSTPFEKKYGTDYLFTPPSIFVADHLADRSDLQLLDTPITSAEWTRLPKLRPSFHKQGLELISPTRPQVNVGNTGTIKLKNPRGRYVMASAVDIDTGKKTTCEVSTNGEDISCRFSSGRQLVTVYAGPKKAKTYWGVGEFEMISN